MSIKRRLERLESTTRAVDQDEEEAISREALKRLTDQELEAYAAALERMVPGEEPPEADWPILARVNEVYEEVRNERL